MSFGKFFWTGYSERNRTINEWKGCKMCYPEKKMFRLSSHFKRMNRVSNLGAQIKLLHNLNLQGLVFKILWGSFHVLGSYKTMDKQTAEPAEPPEPIYFFLKEEQWVEYKVCFRIRIWIFRGWSSKFCEDHSMFSGVTKLWISRPRNLRNLQSPYIFF